MQFFVQWLFSCYAFNWLDFLEPICFGGSHQSCWNSLQGQCCWKSSQKGLSPWWQHLQAHPTGSRIATSWSICGQVQSSQFGKSCGRPSVEIPILEVRSVGGCSIWSDRLPTQETGWSCIRVDQTISIGWSLCICRLGNFYGNWRPGKLCLFLEYNLYTI